MFNYKFTVIMPAYNAGTHISEAIESVIAQTIGFENSIQFIIINDGSTDATEEIAGRYADKYPSNIELITQNNSGASAARNVGLTKASGKYISMLDADDKWESDAFELAFNFFEQHYDEIDTLCCRMRYFGDKDGFHYALDYEYKSSQIVDIQENYKYIQRSASTVIYKHEAITNMRFDENVRYAEDIRFINEIILLKGKYGIIREAVYHYRREDCATSTTNTRKENEYWYSDVFHDVYLHLADLSAKKYGNIIPYMQYLFAFDINVRFSLGYSENRTPEQNFDYFNNLHRLSDIVNTDYFIELNKTPIPRKAALLLFKLGSRKAVADELYHITRVVIDDVELVRNELIISGRDRIEFLDGYDIFIEDETGKKYELNRKITPDYDTHSLTGELIYRGMTFSVSLPLGKLHNYSFIIMSKKGKRKVLKIYYSSTCTIPEGKTRIFPVGKRTITFESNGLYVRR